MAACFTGPELDKSRGNTLGLGQLFTHLEDALYTCRYYANNACAGVISVELYNMPRYILRNRDSLFWDAPNVNLWTNVC